MRCIRHLYGLSLRCANRTLLKNRRFLPPGTLWKSTAAKLKEKEDGITLPNQEFFSYLKRVHKDVSCNSSTTGTGKGKRKWPPNLLEVFGENVKTAEENLSKIVESIEELDKKVAGLDEISVFVAEASEETNSADRDELITIAEHEKSELLKDTNDCNDNIMNELSEMTQNDASVSSVVLEVSAGVGGQEAMLFAAELFDMYDCLCSGNGQGFEVLDYQKSDIGGVYKASANIQFSNYHIFQLLRHESGTHRVQRVPVTERSGRVHTSTASVAILPVPSKQAVTIEEKDVEITPVKKASGGGGQKVNKTETAIRAKHIPSGKVVECNASRSQHDNRVSALKMLAIQLTIEKAQAEETEISKARRQQVRNRERSDKIRTYNFNQDRVTDHRISFTVHNVEDFMSAGGNLVKLLEAVSEKYRLDELDMIIQTLLKEAKKYYNSG